MKEKKSKKKTIIIVVVVLLILGAAFGSQNDKDTSETSTPTSTETTSNDTPEKTNNDNASNTEPDKKSSSKNEKKEKEKFISSCKKYNYKKLARYPEKYERKPITVRVKVAQIVNGGLLDDSSYYRCYTKGQYDTWFENEFFIIDERGEGATKILEDDILTVYSTFTGTEDIDRALTGTTESVPSISMKYCTIKE